MNLNKLKEGNIVVYVDFLNAWGEVTERVEVARFRTRSWAKNFIEYIQSRREEEENAGEYVGYIYDIVEVQ